MAKIKKEAENLEEKPEQPEVQPEERVDGHKELSIEEYIDQLASMKDALAEAQQEIENLKSSNAVGQAHLKMVNLTFDTPDERMGELTSIPRNLIFRLTYQVCLEAMCDPKRDPVLKPLSAIRRLTFFKLMRSVNGQHLIGARMLAQDELRVAQEGEPGEQKAW